MKNNKTKNSKEFDKFGKEFIDLLPLNHFQKLFRQIENFDGETPETLLAKVKNNSMNFPKISEEKQNSLQNGFINSVRNGEFGFQIKTGFEQNIKFIKKSLKKDSRYSQLVNLIKKADGRIEFISYILLKPYINLEQNFIVSCKSINLIEKINNTDKEKRKNSLIELFKEISEPLYKNYLETIWRLSYLTESKMFPKETPKFGELVKQSANRLVAFPNLVTSEIKLLRNSFVHGNYNYNLDDDSFIVWDDKTPKTKISANEITKIANDVTSICIETFPLVAQLYFFRDFFLKSGFLDIWLEKMPILTSENPIEISKAENELSEFAQILTEPMMNFFQTHQ